MTDEQLAQYEYELDRDLSESQDLSWNGRHEMTEDDLMELERGE